MLVEEGTHFGQDSTSWEICAINKDKQVKEIIATKYRNCLDILIHKQKK